MTKRYHSPLGFSTVRGRRIQCGFDGGHVTGNGGIQLLSEVDRRTGLTKSVAGLLEDPRRGASCGHGVLEMLRQRVYALALGEEDLNDHSELRHDLALRAAVGVDSELASPSTLCRLERRAGREAARGRSCSARSCTPPEPGTGSAGRWSRRSTTRRARTPASWSPTCRNLTATCTRGCTARAGTWRTATAASGTRSTPCNCPEGCAGRRFHRPGLRLVTH